MRKIKWGINFRSKSRPSRPRVKPLSIESLESRAILSCTQTVGGGDINLNGACDPADIEELSRVVRDNGIGGNSRHDLNLDKRFDQEDRRIWIQHRANTWYGDSNIDASFDREDFALISRPAEYEDTKPGNSTWAEGDFTGDADFNRFDLVAAHQAGGFGKGRYVGNGEPLPMPTLRSVLPNGAVGDGRVSIEYDAVDGSISVLGDGMKMNSIDIDSKSGIFLFESQTIENFAIDRSRTIFRIDIAGGSFTNLDLGRVARVGLSEQAVRTDLFVMGSLAGGGSLSEVDLVYRGIPAEEDLTKVSVATGRSLGVAGEEDWYQWTAPDRGRLSVELFFDQSRGDAELQLYNSKRKLLEWSSSKVKNENIQFEVLRGETFYIRVFGFQKATQSEYDLLAYLIPDVPRVYVLTAGEILSYDSRDLRLQKGAIQIPTNVGQANDIEIGPYGLIYVSISPTNSRQSGQILEFTPLGQLTRQFTMPADGRVRDLYPRGFDVLEDTTFLIAQPTSKKVIRVDRQGKIIGSQTTKDSPIDATVTRDGTIVWSSEGNLLPVQGLISPTHQGDYWVPETLGRAPSITRFSPLGKELERIKISSRALDVQQTANASLFYVTTDGMLVKQSLGTDSRDALKSTAVKSPIALAVSGGEFQATVPNLLSNSRLSDRDGDALPDVWETNGIDIDNDGIIDLKLPGADPNHKDLYVEIDAMIGRGPDAATLQRVVKAFADVPTELIFNPDGKPGINLHLEFDANGSDWKLPIQNFPLRHGAAWKAFHVVRSQNFGTPEQRVSRNAPKILAAKNLAYRYALFGNKRGTQGHAGLAEEPGRNLMVTLGDWETPGGTPAQQAAVFMHEVGHTLGLDHGGDDDINFKPNYLSVMNYSHIDGSTNLNGKPFLDFSRYSSEHPGDEFGNDTVDEAAIREAGGLGFFEPTVAPNPQTDSVSFRVRVGPNDQFINVSDSNPIDWNRNGQIDAANFPLDVNADRPGELLKSYNDWDNLWFAFSEVHDSSDGTYEDGDDEPVADVCTNFYAGSGSDFFECNDDPEHATPVDSEDIDIDLTIDESEDDDWFILDPIIDGIIEIIIGAVSGILTPPEVDASLRDKDTQSPIAASQIEDGTSTRISIPVSAGKPLFLQIFPESDAVSFADYHLSIFFPGPEETAYWSGNGATDNWSDAGNWQAGAVPVAGANIVFPEDAVRKIVNVEQNRNVGSLFFNGDYTLSTGSLEITKLAVHIDAGSDVSINSSIGNLQAVTQTGTGTLTFNSIAGPWIVDEGTLSGIGSFSSLWIRQEAILAPGIADSAGKIKISDLLDLAGVLKIDVFPHPVSAALTNVELVESDQVLLAATSRLEIRVPSSHAVLGADGSYQKPVISAKAISGTIAGPALDHIGHGVFFEELIPGTNLVEVDLYQAFPGDSDGDGIFNSSDLISVFVAGQYEDAIAGNSNWTTGDWNLDREFDTGDMILAFQKGHYSNASVPAAIVVQQETSWYRNRRRDPSMAEVESADSSAGDKQRFQSEVFGSE